MNDLQDHGVLKAVLAGVWARITWLPLKWIYVMLAIVCVVLYDSKKTQPPGLRDSSTTQ